MKITPNEPKLIEIVECWQEFFDNDPNAFIFVPSQEELENMFREHLIKTNKLHLIDYI